MEEGGVCVSQIEGMKGWECLHESEDEVFMTWSEWKRLRNVVWQRDAGSAGGDADLMGARCPDAASCLSSQSDAWLSLQTRCQRGERERERWWCFGFLLHQIVLIKSVRVKPTWLQTEHGVCFTSLHQTQPLKWGVKEQLHQILTTLRCVYRSAQVKRVR